MTKERLLAQQELINELGAPVIPIVDAIAVLPLIGEIDTFLGKGDFEYYFRQMY
ncbi:hypothetical protein ACFWMS_01490 [Peribacillus butanolivorans]|uniref:hypothetical protein n=1 Tax=Peribacillus butanolivorans TaxID=421767 RepID=UPI00364CF981